MNLLKDSLTQRTALADLPKELVPDGFLDDLAELANYVPEYGVWEEVVGANGKELKVEAAQTRRAIADINSLVMRGEGKKAVKYSDKQIAQNLEEFRISARARIAQIGSSALWAERKKSFERSDRLRKADQEKKVAAGILVTPRNLMQRPLVISNEHDFIASPRTMGKTLQRKFVSPTDRIAFERRHEGENVKVEQLIFDPRRITEMDLINLGVAEPGFLKGKKRKVRLEAISEAISRLKRALGTVSPLRDDFPIKDRFGQHRLYTTGDGYLIGTTNNSGNPGLFRADLINGYNRLIHIDENQGEEKGKMVDLLAKIEAVMTMLSKNWQEVKTPEKLAEVKEKLLKMVEGLLGVRDKDKKALAEAIEKSLDEKISSNPGARLAILVSAKKYLNERLMAMDKIAPYIRRDKEDLDKEKRRHRGIRFEELFLYVETMSARREKRQTPVDSAERKAIFDRLMAWEIEFKPNRGQKEFLEPYRSFCEAALKRIDEAKLVVMEKNGSNREIAQAVLQMYLVAKLQVSWSRLMDIYDRFLVHKGLPYFIDLKNELKSLREILLDKKVGVQGTTPTFDQAYRKLTELVVNLESAAEEGRKLMAEKKVAEARSLRENMSEKVSELDIIGLVKSIGA